GHKNLGRIQADLVPQSLGPVLQTLKRARMRIIPQFTFVTGHGRQLRLERGGNIHPSVGDEAPWVGPFRAARCIKSVDRVYIGFGGTSSDQRRLEKNLMV